MEPTKPLFVCGYPEALTTLGTFTTEAKICDNKCNAEFFVIDCVGVPLLGPKTATQLQLLKIQNIGKVSPIVHFDNL